MNKPRAALITPVGQGLSVHRNTLAHAKSRRSEEGWL